MRPSLLDTTIILEGIPVSVSVTDWGALATGEHLYHFEFTSTAEPARPIPISETGYLSRFIYRSQIASYPSLDAAARAIAKALIPAISEDADQLTLF